MLFNNILTDNNTVFINFFSLTSLFFLYLKELKKSAFLLISHRAGYLVIVKREETICRNEHRAGAQPPTTTTKRKKKHLYNEATFTIIGHFNELFCTRAKCISDLAPDSMEFFFFTPLLF